MPSIVRKVCGGKGFNSPLGDGGVLIMVFAVSPEGRLLTFFPSLDISISDMKFKKDIYVSKFVLNSFIT